MESAYLKMNPPLSENDDVVTLRADLANGSIDWIGSDHAPHTLQEKVQDIWKAPAGVPHLDTFGEFVTLAHRAFLPDLTRLAQVTSHNAAQFYGLDDRGRVAEGHLADLTVLNLNDPHVVEGPFETKAGWSPFEEKGFPGNVTTTIYRGKTLVEEGKLVA